ncbi:hypothetical protein, partial [Alicyclobacillus fructus]|uniref:hypothetical protein n=1 Tax=Alicyclobacillus fructus TaxID=2816082 RepID=UPI001A8F9A8E
MPHPTIVDDGHCVPTGVPTSVAAPAPTPVPTVKMAKKEPGPSLRQSWNIVDILSGGFLCDDD